MMPGSAQHKNGTDFQHLLLKGQCHEIFDPRFFRPTIPLGPLVHRLKLFRKCIRVCEDIRLQKSTLHYAHNVESIFSFS
jgi:hypothetical protein